MKRWLIRLYVWMFPRCIHCGSRKHAPRLCVYADMRCIHGTRITDDYATSYCYQCDADGAER